MSLYTCQEKREEADLLLIPFIEGKPLEETLGELGSWEKSLEPLLSSKDFTGKKQELSLFYPENAVEKRFCLIGLGKQPTVQELTAAYAKALQFCAKYAIHKVNVLFPHILGCKEEEIITSCFEGLLLGNYGFTKYKTEDTKKEAASQISTFVLLTKNAPKGLGKWVDIAESVHFTRDLVNTNADEVNPETLALAAVEMAKKRQNVTATVLAKADLLRERMGLLLAVSRGSHIDPKLIVLSYKGDPTSQDSVAFIGKGVTYDTGGLSLKPTGSMQGMKADMGGAAAVLGLMEAASRLQIKKNIIAVVPTTENAIDGKSYKVGDIYTGYSGKTVEIDNTDAEGRLILADALAYTAKQYRPSMMIDLATLTGAIVVALGEEFSGLFSDNEPLQECLRKASYKVGEKFWPMPVHPPYLELLRSDFADIKNSGSREAGSITAALFLREFTGGIPWAHIDIAGCAFRERASGCHPKNATGEPVRALLSFLEHLDADTIKAIRSYGKKSSPA